MKETHPKIEPFSLVGRGHLHLEHTQPIGVTYQLIALYPNCIGGGFVSSADEKSLHLPEQTSCRLQVGASRSLKVLTGRASDGHVPVISFGIVEAENE